MRSVGIIKEVDRLGRIVIPKELRERYGLTESVEIVATEVGIFLRSPNYKLVKIENEKQGVFLPTGRTFWDFSQVLT